MSNYIFYIAIVVIVKSFHLVLVIQHIIFKGTSLIVLSLMIMKHGKVIFGERHVFNQNKITVLNLAKQIVKNILVLASGTIMQKENAFTGKPS